jgi:hypothetical protein
VTICPPKLRGLFYLVASMNDLIGQPAELRFTVTVTRKDGTQETREMVGRSTVEEAQALGAVEAPKIETEKE